MTVPSIICVFTKAFETAYRVHLQSMRLPSVSSSRSGLVCHLLDHRKIINVSHIPLKQFPLCTVSWFTNNAKAYLVAWRNGEASCTEENSSGSISFLPVISFLQSIPMCRVTNHKLDRVYFSQFSSQSRYSSWLQLMNDTETQLKSFLWVSQSQEVRLT